VTGEGLRTRVAAYRAIRRVHDDGAWSTRAVDAALRAGDLDARDRAFAANLAYETLRWEGTLDWALGQVLTRPLHNVEAELLDVLRLGAWQLLYGHVPDRAAVATAVDLARAEVGARATGFVNGVLRGLGRARLAWPSQETDDGLGLALAYPAWVVAEARRRFGERARAVLEGGNAAPGVTLRAVGDRDALLEELRAGGLDATPGRHAAETVHAPGADPGALPAVGEGRAVVQDEASTLVGRAVWHGVAELTEPRVLDVAAAPGGKSTHLAQLGARVVAADLHPGRAGQLADAVRRLGLGDRVAVLAADAGAPPLRPEAFDAVLVDAPCSGLGVVRRRPELRWRVEPGDPARLGALQLRLLESAAAAVRPGGWLVYSVCTWPLAETAEVVAGFLAVNGDRFAHADPATLACGAGAVLDGDHGLQLDPDCDGTDAMYLAAFRRTA
jgi:16S rRNA (cytosine967-C5)-methyltransferase